MSQLKSVNIPKPCHETWQAMTPINGGRYCQSCCKTVTDFTVMSNDEIISYLSSHTNVCGRIQDIQIAGINESITKPAKHMPVFLNYHIAALLAGILALTRVETYGKIRQPVKTEQRQTRQDTTVKDTSNYIKVSGTIYAKDDGTPIPGASITITGTGNGVATNSEGYFEIKMPLKTKSMEIKAIGFQPQTLKIKKLSKTNYKVYLPMSEAVLGGIILTY